MSPRGVVTKRDARARWKATGRRLFYCGSDLASVAPEYDTSARRVVVMDPRRPPAEDNAAAGRVVVVNLREEDTAAGRVIRVQPAGSREERPAAHATPGTPAENSCAERKGDRHDGLTHSSYLSTPEGARKQEG